MKISTKSRYGARAIIEIALGNIERPVKRKDISEKQGIPDSYLKNILISLKNSGIINAVRGAGGGYVLGRAPSEITLLDIIKALEGNPDFTECISYPVTCKRVDSCVTRDIWKKVSDAQESILKGITIGEILENAEKGLFRNYSI